MKATNWKDKLLGGREDIKTHIKEVVDSYLVNQEEGEMKPVPITNKTDYKVDSLFLNNVVEKNCYKLDKVEPNKQLKNIKIS